MSSLSPVLTIILGSVTGPGGDVLRYWWLELEGATVLQDWSHAGTGGEAALNLGPLPSISIGTYTLISENCHEHVIFQMLVWMA